MEECARYSGADLAALAREASLIALMEQKESNSLAPPLVCQRHFIAAVAKVPLPILYCLNNTPERIERMSHG